MHILATFNFKKSLSVVFESIHFDFISTGVEMCGWTFFGSSMGLRFKILEFLLLFDMNLINIMCHFDFLKILKIIISRPTSWPQKSLTIFLMDIKWRSKDKYATKKQLRYFYLVKRRDSVFFYSPGSFKIQIITYEIITAMLFYSQWSLMMTLKKWLCRNKHGAEDTTPKYSRISWTPHMFLRQVPPAKCARSLNAQNLLQTPDRRHESYVGLANIFKRR